MKLRTFVLLAAAVGWFAHDGRAQGTPQCNQSFHFTGSGVAPIINTTAGSTNGCVGWRLTFRVTGFTAAKIEIDGSQDGITFAAIDSTLVQEGVNPTNWTSATVSNTIVVRAYLPFIQVNLVSVTGSGSLNTLMLGYVGTSAQQDNGGGGGGGGITALTKDVAATGPGSVPATVQGLEGTPFCTGFTPVQGSLVQYTINSAPNPCWEEVPPNTSGIQMFLSQTGISGVAGDANWQPGQAAGLLTYYLTDTASDVATYLQQTTLPYSPKTTLTYSALPNGASTIQNWATVPGIPNLSFIPAGAYQCHLHMLKSPFGSATIACEFVEVNAAGVDIGVIGTTDSITNPAQIETQYTLDFADGNVYTLASTSSRIVCRVIATAVTGAPNIEIFVGGTADSHMSLPSNAVDASNFVPYVGAVKTLDMGTFGVVMGSTHYRGTTNIYQGAATNGAAAAGTPFCDDGSGNATTSGCTGGSSITLKTNGTNNGSQSTLNLAQGTGITLVDNGSGTVTVASTGGAGAANPSCTFSALDTGCTAPTTSIDVSSLGATSNDQFLVQCWTGASTTQTAVTITSYVYTTGSGIIQTVAPAFASAAAAGYCVANGNGSGGSGGGSSIASTTFAALPGTCTSGNLYLFTNSAISSALCGASNTYSYFVSGLGKVTPPVIGSFTAVNTPTTSTTNGGIVLTAPQSGSDNYRLLVQNLPSAPYTVTSCMISPNPNSQFLPVGLALYDGTKLAAITAYYDSGNGGIGVKTAKFNSVTSFSGYYNTASYAGINGLLCFRIQDDSTNRIMSWSADNVNFVVLTSVSDTDFLVPTQVGLAADSANGTFASTGWFVHFLTTNP